MVSFQPASRGPLLIVGASARAAANAAARAGFDVTAVDFFGDDDLRQVANVATVSSYDEVAGLRLQLERLTPCLYGGGVENHPQTVECLQRDYLLWGATPQQLAAVCNPFALQQALGGQGLLFPTTLDSLPEHAQLDRFLRKPLLSTGGIGITPAQSNEPADAASHAYQEYIAGQPASGAFVGTGSGAVFLGSAVAWVGPLDDDTARFRYQGSMSQQLAGSAHEALQRAGDLVARTFHLRGLFGIDVIVDAQERCWILEVNPRYTASLEVLEWAADDAWNAIDLHARACHGHLSADFVVGLPVARAAKRIVFADRAGVTGQGFHKLRESAEQDRARYRLADLPAHGTSICPGQPICTVLAKHADCAELEARVEQGVRDVLRVWSSDI